MNKLNVALIFGGRSAEHEISIMTAREVMKVIDKEKYNITLMGISKSGHWSLYDAVEDTVEDKTGVMMPPEIVSALQKSDVAFPLLHGPYGEDGRIQGMFEMMGLKYVGADMIGSAVCMDKDYCKKLLEVSDIPVVPYATVKKGEEITITSYPVFVKPANMGSSIGITKANSDEEYRLALEEAFKYDNKVIVEIGVNAIELECAVIGNEEPIVSGVGQINTTHEFYDYDSKYFDEGSSDILVPAPINEGLAEEIRTTALMAYKALDLKGMSRLDFFYDRKNEKVYLNEINTIPGFTPFSMFPVLFAERGIEYKELIDRLIGYALER